VFISCGYYHSASLTENGDVYTWGNNAHGELGHGSVQDALVPTLVEALGGKRIKNVACGSFHTVVITDLHNVYSWGRGGKGRLGHGEEQDRQVPALLDFLLGKRT
jgi:RCC1 and BTB domain-containing protein